GTADGRLPRVESQWGPVLQQLVQSVAAAALSELAPRMIPGALRTHHAKEAIVSYTNNAAELLKRRKVHRDVIFKYLAKEGVVMPPNSDKHQLVQRTFELWTSGRTLHLLLSWVFSQSVFERREGEE
ncbi:hypothetical protein CRUP_016562, partial [Coryphaenoides rupestris]